MGKKSMKITPTKKKQVCDSGRPQVKWMWLSCSVYGAPVNGAGAGDELRCGAPLCALPPIWRARQRSRLNERLTREK